MGLFGKYYSGATLTRRLSQKPLPSHFKQKFLPSRVPSFTVQDGRLGDIVGDWIRKGAPGASMHRYLAMVDALREHERHLLEYVQYIDTPPEQEMFSEEPNVAEVGHLLLEEF